MQLYLRDALRTDVRQLVELLVDGQLSSGVDDPAHPNRYLSAFDEIDARDDSFLIVAELGGAIAGMLQLITFRHLQHIGGRCAEIESMHVSGSVRNRGVGSRLIGHAVERARDLGCYRIQLTSNVARPDAHRFYERHGFVASHAGFKRYLDT